MSSNIYANRYHDTSKRFRGFLKLMLVWKGSVFKLIWHNLLAFCLFYSLLSLLYRHVLQLDPMLKETFDMICIFAARSSAMIPVTFLTGFYVTQVVSRYWDQFMSLPWPDRFAYKLVSFVPGNTGYHRTLRRTVMRYINLSTVLVFRLVAAKVHARFPDYTSLQKAGLMLPDEVARLEAVDGRTPHETSWTPILWAVDLLQRERSAGRIVVEAPIYASLISSFDYLNDCNRRIFNHGWVNFPLAYTQVATLSVYAYLFASLFSHQFLLPSPKAQDVDTFPYSNVTFSTKEPFLKHTPDVYVPVFAILEFIGYMGWIKVAETLLNPWGDDDEDFQINYLIDRNFQVSYLIVDESTDEKGLEEDPFYAQQKDVPAQLPDDRTRDRRRCPGSWCSKMPQRIRRPWMALQDRRAHRCQSTRSRLRSLNENRHARSRTSIRPDLHQSRVTFKTPNLQSPDKEENSFASNPFQV